MQELLMIVEVDGANLAVRRLLLDESAPTIVFLHDSLGCITLWRDFPERLARATNCNALIYDRQGYGQSTPFTSGRDIAYLEHGGEVFLRFLDAVKLEKCIAFGHSDGGSIALVASSIAPDRFHGVITEGAHVFVEDITLNGIRAVQAQYMDSARLKERLRKYHGDKTEAVFSAWADTWTDPKYRQWNIERYLGAITCPILVVQGVEDEFGSERQVDAIVGQVSGPAAKAMVPGAAHTPHKEKPDQTLELTSLFINETVKRLVQM